ncbi:MAG: glycoside hydrolase family 30 protein [Longimicrobiales bacterium]
MSRLTTLRRRAGLMGIGALVALGSALPGQALAASAASQADMDTVTIRVDPSYHGQIFEGWGTSLGWFANATGSYPDEIRERLADMVFGENGLALNIARYNIGGGNAPDVGDYLRPGGAVEGWWAAPDGIAHGDVDWWDPADPRHWNADADKTQRWWIDRIKAGIDRWEAFSNSPPWFMTVSGYVSGGFDANEDQLRTKSVDDFAAYLVGVVERLEAAHGIEFSTIEPFNEPNTSYWSTRLSDDGEPVARQEGAHMGPELQQAVIRSLAAELDQAATDAVIAAMDETNPGLFIRNSSSYAADVRDHVAQLNVHTYGTERRTAVRDIAKGEDKRLWMSEVEGSFGEGRDFESMEPGLGIARHIVDDIRELEPSAWLFWQPVEDYDNMAPRGGSAGGNWGSIHIRFDCTARDTLDTCPIYMNTKYHTIRNFTHHIRPGDRFVNVDDVSSVAAISASGRTAIVVHINDSDRGRHVTLDLSAFGSVEPGATVTPVVTSADGALIIGEPAPVEGHGAMLTVPASSVTTFLVDGVAGVAPDA